MKLNEWLDLEAGRGAKLASHFGRTASAISQWRTNGVPTDFMKAVRNFSGGDITLEEMVPEPELIATEGAPAVQVKADA